MWTLSDSTSVRYKCHPICRLQRTYRKRAVLMLCIPGEPFTGVGRALKDTEGWELVIPTCNTNGKQGYFPMKEAYDEGGYEAGSSNFRAGVAGNFQ